MAGSNLRGVVSVVVEAARHEDPLEPAARRSWDGERSVENRVHVGTAVASPGSAIAANVRVVSSDENGR